MSIAALEDVALELRRLAAAGSGLAGGDFRLGRLVEPLRRSAGGATGGATGAAVFGKVADLIETLTGATGRDSAGAFLELATLVHAVLYTQGQTGGAAGESQGAGAAGGAGGAGELLAIESLAVGLSTMDISAGVLRPTVEALTRTGPGRLAVIQEAHEKGLFQDVRLLGPALAALDDSFHEIGDFVAEHVAPGYGPAIAPMIEAGLHLKGGAGDARKLRLLGRILGESRQGLYERALSEGSKEVRIAAIGCLSRVDGAVPLLLDQAGDRSAEVRAAVLEAVGDRSDERAADVLIAAMRGKDLAAAVEPIRRSANPRVRAAVLTELDAAVQRLTAGGKDASDAAGASLLLLESLATYDKAAEQLLLGVLDQAGAIGQVKTSSGYFTHSGAAVLAKVGAMLVAHGSAAARRRLIEAGDAHGGVLFDEALIAANAMLSPGEFYERYAGWLSRKGNEASSRVSALRGFLEGRATAGRLGAAARERAPDGGGWDARWLDDAIAADKPWLVALLARPGHGACGDYLAGKLASFRIDRQFDLLLGLLRAEHERVIDYICEQLAQAPAEKYRDPRRRLLDLIPHMPEAALERVMQVAPKLPDNLAGELVERVQQRRDPSAND